MIAARGRERCVARIARGFVRTIGAMSDRTPPHALVDDRPGEGVFRVHRDAFCRDDVFELELDALFERGWVYLGHESQLPRPNDYLTTWVGRVAVVVMRDETGRLGAFLNSCRHKGAQVVHRARGNARLHLCRYHGWSYDSAGRNVVLRARADGAYPPSFDDAPHGLQPLAAFASHRGFLFGSLSDPGTTLADHLGDARIFLDLVVDQSEQGIELLPGDVRYTFRANWKFQLENTVDAYHFPATHPSYLRLMDRRARMGPREGVARSVWQGDDGVQLDERMGAFTFAHGHVLVWTTSPPERHPLYAQREALGRRVGAERASWMLRTRQLDVFPNLQIGSSAAIQMRVIRPLAPDLTEVSTWCIAPVGESADARRQRLRQYEDFYNPSGMATPDDTVNYEDCQRGMRSGRVPWQQAWLQGHARGTAAVRPGADAHARALGIRPATSSSGPFALADETVFHGLYREWAARLRDAETSR